MSLTSRIDSQRVNFVERYKRPIVYEVEHIIPAYANLSRTGMRRGVDWDPRFEKIRLDYKTLDEEKVSHPASEWALGDQVAVEVIALSNRQARKLLDQQTATTSECSWSSSTTAGQDLVWTVKQYSRGELRERKTSVVGVVYAIYRNAGQGSSTSPQQQPFVSCRLFVAETVMSPQLFRSAFCDTSEADFLAEGELIYVDLALKEDLPNTKPAKKQDDEEESDNDEDDNGDLTGPLYYVLRAKRFTDVQKVAMLQPGSIEVVASPEYLATHYRKAAAAVLQAQYLTTRKETPRQLIWVDANWTKTTAPLIGVFTYAPDDVEIEGGQQRPKWRAGGIVRMGVLVDEGPNVKNIDCSIIRVDEANPQVMKIHFVVELAGALALIKMKKPHLPTRVRCSLETKNVLAKEGRKFFQKEDKIKCFYVPTRSECYNKIFGQFTGNMVVDRTPPSPNQVATFTWPSIRANDPVMPDAGQRAVGYAALHRRDPFIVCQSPAGSGKSSLLAHLALSVVTQARREAARRRGDDPPVPPTRVALLAPTNRAADALAEALSRLNADPSIRVTRLYSKHAEATTPPHLFDLAAHHHLNNMKELCEKELTELENRACRKYDQVVSELRDVELNVVNSSQALRNATYAAGKSETLRQFKPLVEDIYWHRYSPSIIICTLSAFQNAPFPMGYASHVYFDEASLAVQYSTMMCLARLSPRTARQVIFVGDIRQLCPQVDRLTGDSSLVAVGGVLDGFDTRHCSPSTFHLSTNYRSHPVMVDMFTELTYQHDKIKLIAGAPIKRRSAVVDRMPMACEAGPICAINVEGREAASGGTSLSNRAEAEAAATLVRALLTVGMKTEDIVVISMYETQRRLIGYTLEREGVRGINVFNVDKAQGSEAEVVILSLVRASGGVSGGDREASERARLGFISSPRRSLVALSRARSALFVLAHFDTVRQSDYWTSFLEYVNKIDAIAPPNYIPALQWHMKDLAACPIDWWYGWDGRFAAPPRPRPGRDRQLSPPWPHLQPISVPPPPPCQFGRRTPPSQHQAKRQPRGRGYAVYRNQTPPRPGSPLPQAGPSGIQATKRAEPPQEEAPDSPETTEAPYNKELVVEWLKDSSNPHVTPLTHSLALGNESGQSSVSSCEMRSASTVGWPSAPQYAEGMDVDEESPTKNETRAKSPGRARSGLASAFQSPAEGDSWSAGTSFVDDAIRRADAATADAKETEETIRTALRRAAPPSEPCGWPEL
uniref:Uncharacterized protein n=1 Tax=Plectus sambesii TaxID=2011161 RepID=A0A914WN94_9BILA